MSAAPSPPPLSVVRAADLTESQTQPRWLVEGLWAHSGVGVLGGAPKSCKSFLALDLALSVASGTPCLDSFAVPTAGAALVYFAEDATPVVKSRLDDLCHHRQLALDSLPLWLITAPALRLDLGTDQRRLEQAVRTLQPRLLVLDPFVRLHRIDENDAGQVSGVLAFLRSLQRTHDLAVLLVHHTRKNGPTGKQAGLGLRGSGDLHAWGDSNLYLRRLQDHLVLTVEHRAARPPDPLSLSLVGGDDQGPVHLRLLDPPAAADVPASQNLAAAVLQQLARAQEPQSRAALRQCLRVRNERLGDTLAQLLADHQILRVADGYIPIAAAVPIPCIRECTERNASSAP